MNIRNRAGTLGSRPSKIQRTGQLAALAALAALAPVQLSASAININISRVNTLISITGAAAFAGQGTSFTNTSNSDTGTGTVDTGGNASMEPQGGVGLNDKFNVGVGNETWSGLMVGNNAGVISDQEKNPAPAPKVGPQSLNSSYGSYLEQNGLFYETFTLIDTGTDAYSFTSLQLLKGLSLSDLTPGAFDSAGVIATGSLYDNVTSRLGIFTIAPGQQIEFSVGPVNPNTYSLLNATVQEMLPGGGTGPSQTLALAATPAPEPGSLALFLIGLGAVARTRLSRGGRRLG